LLKSGLRIWTEHTIVAPTVKQGFELGFWKKAFDLTKKKLKLRGAFAANHDVTYPDLLADTIYGLPYPENLVFLMQQLNGRQISTEFMFHLGYSSSKSFFNSEDMTDIPHGIDHYYFVNRIKELDALLSVDLDSELNKNELKKIFFSEL
jgi:hypothetical protein